MVAGLLLCAWFACQPAGAPQAPAIPQPPTTAAPSFTTPETLVAAIAVHDARLRSLEWRQRVTVALDAEHPSTVLQESTQGFDDLGHWYLQQKYGVVPESRDSVTYFELFAEGRDEETKGMQRPDTHVGTVCITETMSRCVYPSPEALLGRWLDVSCDCPLSEVLRRSKKMEVVKTDGAIVRLRSWRPLNGCSTYIDVDCDASREFLPVRIEYFDVLLDSPIATFETKEATKMDGVWIPVRGTKTVWVRTWTDDQVRAVLDDIVRQGFPQPWDPEDEGLQAAHKRAIEKVFGPAGIPVAPMAGWVNVLEVTEILSVNRALDEERARVPYPPGWRMFNTLLDTMENPDGSDKVAVPRYDDPPEKDSADRPGF